MATSLENPNYKVIFIRLNKICDKVFGVECACFAGSFIVNFMTAVGTTTLCVMLRIFYFYVILAPCAITVFFGFSAVLVKMY